ncbi:MAG: sugar phosphate isomerase/epimerase [Anaerolineae bacterium]|nr:sugar phosphate isomerase/epimerase [Anaerolineae bacterium]
MNRLTLSTMWMQNRFERLADFVRAALDLGFDGIEVSHIVTPAMVGDDDPAQLAIRSVHYPAPVLPSPYGRSADSLLSAADEDARRWAVEQGRRTVDFACRAGAMAVCLHLGEVPVPWRHEWALRQRYLAGQRGTPAYARAQAELTALRQAQAEAALTAALRSLEELAAYAAPRGVRLGVESRYHYHEIPGFDELGWLLERTDPAVVGFWYDMGHVQTLHNLGLTQHEAWLEAYAGRVVGVHFHDVVGLRDHLIPGLGELDFDAIVRRLPADAALTCEFDWYYEPEEVRQGAAVVTAALQARAASSSLALG